MWVSSEARGNGVESLWGVWLPPSADLLLPDGRAEDARGLWLLLLVPNQDRPDQAVPLSLYRQRPWVRSTGA